MAVAGDGHTPCFENTIQDVCLTERNLWN
jgi:hypothetical protein